MAKPMKIIAEGITTLFWGHALKKRVLEWIIYPDVVDKISCIKS